MKHRLDNTAPLCLPTVDHNECLEMDMKQLLSARTNRGGGAMSNLDKSNTRV